MGDHTTSLPRSQLQEIVSTMVYAAEADTPEQVLRRIAHASRKLIGTKYAALGIPDKKNGEFSFFEASGMSKEASARIAHPPMGKGLLGAIIKDRRPISTSDITSHPDAGGLPDGHPPMTSFLGVPIQVGNQLLGLLYLTDKKNDQPFDEADQWMAETMARYAALAIAGSQLREQQRRLTLLEERQRIGMELHDGVIQSLYALGMKLDLARSIGPVTTEDTQEVIDGLNNVIEDIRAYIMDLRSMGKQKTIHQSVCDIVARLYVPRSLSVNIEAPHQLPPFAPSDFESICSVAREALSNAMRHANAQKVSIHVSQEADSFEMVIRDDGQGFNPKGISKDAGLGLRNMRERVRLHQGKISIETVPNEGTTITVVIPIQDNKTRQS